MKALTWGSSSGKKVVLPTLDHTNSASSSMDLPSTSSTEPSASTNLMVGKPSMLNRSARVLCSSALTFTRLIRLCSPRTDPRMESSWARVLQWPHQGA